MYKAANFFLIFGLAIGTLGAAQARRVHHRPVARHYFRPAIISGRNYMDSGSVVPEGSLSNYMTINTVFGHSIILANQPDSFGDDVMPNVVKNPGRPQPLFEFSTGGD